MILSYYTILIFGDENVINDNINNINNEDIHINDDIFIDVDNNIDNNIGNSVDEFYEESNKYSFFFPKSIPIYNVRKYNYSGNFITIKDNLLYK